MAVMSWRELQDEQAAWSLRNFGDQPVHHSLLGIVEEIGEYTEAQTEADREDAVADVLIFMSGYCTRNGFALQDVIDRAHHDPARTSILAVHVGRLAHAHLKGEQRIRGDASAHAEAKMAALAGIVSVLDGWCASRDVRMFDLAAKVWSSVSQRDWRRAPADGLSAVE